MRTHKEAIMVVISAWSVASMALLMIFLTAKEPIIASQQAARAHITLTLLVMSITGAGWLWFRSDLKSSH